MDEGPAHVVDLVHKVVVESKRTAVIVDAIDAVVVCLAVARAGEDMDLVSATFQGSSEFGNVYPHSTHGDGMESFPGKQGNAHKLDLLRFRSATRHIFVFGVGLPF
jgi:hypothetical protein